MPRSPFRSGSVQDPKILRQQPAAAKKNLSPGQFLDIDVDHEVYQMLDYRGMLCDPDFAFRKDICENEALNNITFLKYGVLDALAWGLSNPWDFNEGFMNPWILNR